MHDFHFLFSSVKERKEERRIPLRQWRILSFFVLHKTFSSFMKNMKTCQQEVKKNWHKCQNFLIRTKKKINSWETFPYQKLKQKSQMHIVWTFFTFNLCVTLWINHWDWNRRRHFKLALDWIHVEGVQSTSLVSCRETTGDEIVSSVKNFTFWLLLWHLADYDLRINVIESNVN